MHYLAVIYNVPDKDRKAFAADLKTIYQAADEKKALAVLDRVTETEWAEKRIPKRYGPFKSAVPGHF